MSDSPGTLRGYQDSDFEVVEVAGRGLESVECLLGDSGYPEGLLLHVEGVGWAHCYLDAWLGFWSFLDEDDVATLRGDYSGLEIDDVGKRLLLVGKRLQDAKCSRTQKGTSIELRFASGVLCLSEVDPADHASRSQLEWRQLE